MTKMEFILALNGSISGLPADEVEERLDFYSEMIDDLMEEGFSEEEAVAKMGAPEEIAKRIIADTPFSAIVKEKIKQRKKTSGWTVVLLILGFPLWLPILAAAFAVLLSLYIVLWSVVISLWAVNVALGASALGCAAGAAIMALTGRVSMGTFAAGGALLCAGLTIFMFFGCKAVTKCIIILSKAIIIGIKRSFVRKERAQ